MKVGRNAPCPCGSGKKFKKCCLSKEESQLAARAMSSTRDAGQRAPRTAAVSAIPAGHGASDMQAREETEEERYWNRFWDRFRSSKLDQKLTMAREAIEQRDDFDGEWAFELVSSLEEPLRKAERIPELEALLDLVATRRPEAYVEEGGWLNLCRVENALLLPCLDLKTPLLALAPHVVRVIDPFFSLMAGLMYHGKADELIAALEPAWAHIRDSEDIMPHAEDELRGVALWLLLERHLETHPTATADDRELLDATTPYRRERDLPWLVLAIEQRTGRRATGWKQEEFGPLQNCDEFDKSAFLITVEFANALHGHWGWPRSRAELAREQFFTFILDRAAESTREGRKKPTKGSGRATSDSASPFCSLFGPKHAGKFLSEQLNAGFGFPHKAATFSQALPPWLQFLNEQRLLDEKEANHLYGGLKSSCVLLPKDVEMLTWDPQLSPDVELAWASRPQFHALEAALRDPVSVERSA